MSEQMVAVGWLGSCSIRAIMRGVSIEGGFRYVQ
jgi:hypothetical protein